MQASDFSCRMDFRCKADKKEKFINEQYNSIIGEVERLRCGPARVATMSLLSDWQKKDPKPALANGEILAFCPRCTRLQAKGLIVANNAFEQKEEYYCTKCGFHFTMTYTKR